MKRNPLALVLLFLFALFTGCAGTTPTVPIPTSSAAPTHTASPFADASPTPSTAPEDPTQSASSESISAAPTAEPSPAEALDSSLTDGVILARSVFLHPTGVAFWGADDAFCSALTDNNGMLYDFVVEGTLPSELWSLAIFDDDGFLGTSDGLFRFSLTEFQQRSAQMELLNEIALYDGFSIYENQIYYLSGSSLYAMPMEGGTPSQLLSGVLDYNITTRGVYYTDENGGLYHKPFGDAQPELLSDTPAESRFILHDGSIYYWTPSGQVFCWSPGAGSLELSLSRNVDPEESLWATEDILIYTDMDGDVHQYSLTDGSDTLREELYTLPEKEKGFLQDNVLYYRYSDSVYWDNLVTGETGGISLSEFADAATSPSSAPVATSTPTAFDISAGLEVHLTGDQKVLTNNYFSLSLPAAPDWAVEATDSNTLVFYYPPGRDAGYGGNFLTIKAFDWSDNEYADYPHWTMAGMDANKKYVAIFPTDVRFDVNDATQQEEYQILFSAAQAIDDTENPTGNPFVVLQP